MRRDTTMNMTEGKPMVLLTVFAVPLLIGNIDRKITKNAIRLGLPLLLLWITDIGVWTIWATAGLTWALAGFSCLLRYFSWRKKMLMPGKTAETQNA